MSTFSKRSCVSRLSASGFHLFDADSGINLLIDEINIPQSGWSKAPQQLSIALTNACDLSCSYCYAPKHASTLDPNVVMQWIEEASSNGCLGVGFGGGEPTLHPNFTDLVEWTRRNTNMAVTTTTHGHWRNFNKIASVLPNIDLVRLSIDGIGDTYERLRGRPFSSITESAQAITHSTRLGVNTVVNGDTLPELDEILQKCETLGACELLLLPEYGPTGCNLNNNSLDELASWIRNQATNVRIAVSSQGSELLNVPLLDTGEDHLAYLHITADCILKKCSFSSTGTTLSGDGKLLQSIPLLPA
ncbi:MAG: radical SAM protein [Phycisphaerales bacterium JB040]